MGFRRYPEKQTFPCTPFVEKQCREIVQEDGVIKCEISEVNLNVYSFPEGTREKYDLEKAIAAGENLRQVPSTLIESDLGAFVATEQEQEQKQDV